MSNIKRRLQSFFIMEIPFRKSKNVTLYLAGFLLILAAMFLLFMPPLVAHTVFGSSLFFGIIAILFLASAFKLIQIAWRRTNSRSPGMLVNAKGIEDFTSKINEGFLSWSEVADFEVKEVVSSKFIVVYLHNPEQYLSSQKKGWRKNQLLDRYKNYGSPYCVATTSLQTNTKALYELLKEYKSQYDAKAIAGTNDFS